MKYVQAEEKVLFPREDDCLSLFLWGMRNLRGAGESESVRWRNLSTMVCKVSVFLMRTALIVLEYEMLHLRSSNFK